MLLKLMVALLKNTINHVFLFNLGTHRVQAAFIKYMSDKGMAKYGIVWEEKEETYAALILASSYWSKGLFLHFKFCLIET